MPASSKQPHSTAEAVAVERPRDLVAAAAVVAATVANINASPAAVEKPDQLLRALAAVHWLQAELAAAEPVLIAAARDAGVSWQALAPVLGVASRQAAERRYLRLIPAGPGQPGSTRDGRVRAERDRRAGHRAVAQWANDNTADLRRLAGQISALADLDHDSQEPIDRLHRALADADASALPVLLAETQRYLQGHPHLADQVDSLTAEADRLRRQTQERRDGTYAER